MHDALHVLEWDAWIVGLHTLAGASECEQGGALAMATSMATQEHRVGIGSTAMAMEMSMAVARAMGNDL